jgi:DNA primase
MRGRVVFGIHDTDGDLVGFTGRAAPGDTDAPKWLNTPTTAIFTKGELLFGYTENRDRLADGATPVRVEGVMDALAVTLASDGRAVGLAPLGTALTAAQADQLAHIASRKIVLHGTDDDPAGLKAASRDYWLLTARGVDVRKLVLTDGEYAFNDPAEAHLGAPESLAAALDAVDRAPPLAGHLLGELISQNRDILADGHLHAVVGIARQIGIIVAAAPLDQHDDLMTAAAAMLADVAPDDADHYLELINPVTAETDPIPTRPPASDDVEPDFPATGRPTNPRFAAAAAALAELHQEAHHHPIDAAADPESGTPSRNGHLRHHGTRPHDVKIDEPERER